MKKHDHNAPDWRPPAEGERFRVKGEDFDRVMCLQDADDRDLPHYAPPIGFGVGCDYVPARFTWTEVAQPLPKGQEFFVSHLCLSREGAPTLWRHPSDVIGDVHRVLVIDLGPVKPKPVRVEGMTLPEVVKWAEECPEGKRRKAMIEDRMYCSKTFGGYLRIHEVTMSFDDALDTDWWGVEEDDE